jgi:two-component system, OmpR family, response regulator MtrA
LTIVSVDEVTTNTSLPIVVCVSPDPGVRERLARQLDGRGVVVMCPDLPALRALLSGGNASLLAGAPARAEVIAGVVTSEEIEPELTIDVPDHLVRWRGEPLPLTRLECELVARLGSEPVRLWTYEKLFATVWGGAYLGDNSILHSAVKRLRRKLRAVDPGLGIETVRGIGYRLVTP